MCARLRDTSRANATRSMLSNRFTWPVFVVDRSRQPWVWTSRLSQSLVGVAYRCALRTKLVVSTFLGPKQLNTFWSSRWSSGVDTNVILIMSLISNGRATLMVSMGRNQSLIERRRRKNGLSIVFRNVNESLPIVAFLFHSIPLCFRLTQRGQSTPFASEHCRDWKHLGRACLTF